MQHQLRQLSITWGGLLEAFEVTVNSNFSSLSFYVFSTINRYTIIRNPKSKKDSVRPCSSLTIPTAPHWSPPEPWARDGSVRQYVRSFLLMSEQNLEVVCPVFLEVNWDPWEPSCHLIWLAACPASGFHPSSCWTGTQPWTPARKAAALTPRNSCQLRRQTLLWCFHHHHPNPQLPAHSH